MQRSIHIVTATIIISLFTLVGTSVQARGTVPAGHQLKAPRDSSRSMAKRLRRYGMPMKMVLAPLRIARSHQKMNKMRSPVPAKFQINGVLPTKGTHAMTATKGSVSYAQNIANTAKDRSASYKYTGPGGKGKMGLGESISIKQDVVHHRSWKLKGDGTRVQTDRLASPRAAATCCCRPPPPPPAPTAPSRRAPPTTACPRSASWARCSTSWTRSSSPRSAT